MVIFVFALFSSNQIRIINCNLRDYILHLSLVLTILFNLFIIFELYCRWQQEVSETVFETVNLEADKVENKRKSKQKTRFDADEKESDCILHGYIKKLGGAFASVWQTRYAKLYPNRYLINN